MSGQHRWTALGLTGTGILGLTVTSGLAMLAHRFVDEFSRPHTLLDETEITWAVPQFMPEPPLVYQRSLLFKTSDGTMLRGDFWAQPRVAPTIVLCHGYRISRSHLRPVAALEYSRGYNILLFDLRGHGDSDSVMTSGGNVEVHDLEAAIVVARSQPETLAGKIIIHGFSMGAAIALLTPPQPEHVAAIIADSPFARSDEVLRRLVHFIMVRESSGWIPALHWLRCFFPALIWTTFVMCVIDFRLRFGYNFVARPDSSFKRWNTYAKTALQQRAIPILLIHSAGDPLIPIEHALQIAAEARVYGVPLETYFVAASSHCGAYGYDPYQYSKVLQRFLARYLGDDLPVQHRKIDAINQ
ncbi:alpha/beta fold hydrolase [Ktedonosporobacter rubrisoli]|uniref:Alpha/beta fold hydrolase n=1 Tax=Ktedonosporobacter rubrisoli TaxID=2509675 RepID=A0A4P6K447_KTERU|nr:alpha/beta fold hydrolase [Ktedonosporobacter rubrisoli]QBD83067.1 alpha/beta fold hydrolase [Ktedonosporobacter rubrisoli]